MRTLTAVKSERKRIYLFGAHVTRVNIPPHLHLLAYTHTYAMRACRIKRQTSVSQCRVVVQKRLFICVPETMICTYQGGANKGVIDYTDEEAVGVVEDGVDACQLLRRVEH